ncbi:MAG: hypothetical protein FH758_11420 [Firmicutes bacterium]|nr:hypothetical protein [Bacillota bacterium]
MSFAGSFFAGIILVVLLVFLFTALLQYLWNITMPQVFNLKEITFWQAFRLIIISAILFGGGGEIVNINN